MATITVTNLNDNGNGSLRQAIAEAGAGDTINFAAGLSGGTLTLTSGALGIASNVTIDGDIDGNHTPDITISGGGNSGVFYVSGGTSTLDGLVVTGGQANYGGGVYLGPGASLTVKDSTLQGNTASSFGGGVYVRPGGALTVMDSTLSGNSTGGYGGGICDAGTLTLVNSTVSDNTAFNGAGIRASGGATVSVYDSTLTSNQATDFGGGIANYGHLTLVDSLLSGNQADLGGGVYNAGTGTFALVSSTLSGNHASFGGGIDNASNFTLTNATLSGNDAADAGGGIYSFGNMTLVNSIVAGNEAGVTGADLRGTPLILSGGNIVGDTFSIDGTTARTGIALSDIFASVVTNPYTNVASGALANNGGPVETVALKVSASNPAIDAGADARAPATDARGFARSDFPGAANNGTNISDLGAYEVSHQIVVTTLDDVTDPSDGLISLREAIADAKNSSGTSTITFDPTLAGGTLTLTNGELDIASDVTIEGDIDHNGTPDITISGGGSSRIFQVDPGSTADFDGLVITDGSATDGGGLYAHGATVTVTDSTLSRNSASMYGGAIWSLASPSH